MNSGYHEHTHINGLCMGKLILVLTSRSPILSHEDFIMTVVKIRLKCADINYSINYSPKLLLV